MVWPFWRTGQISFSYKVRTQNPTAKTIRSLRTKGTYSPGASPVRIPRSRSFPHPDKLRAGWGCRGLMVHLTVHSHSRAPGRRRRQLRPHILPPLLLSSRGEPWVPWTAIAKDTDEWEGGALSPSRLLVCPLGEAAFRRGDEQRQSGAT